MALARNLWWTWNNDAQALFQSLDPVLWEAAQHNPIRVVVELPQHRREALAVDPDFAARLKSVEQSLRAYLDARAWFDRVARSSDSKLRVAYFCAEFGIHECLPIYSGGLGVLAGDHLKSASDLGIPLTAVGLLYRSGYFQQQLLADGSQRALYPAYDFDRLPIHDTGKTIAVTIGRRSVRTRIWEARVGRVPLYLLDADVPANHPEDRAITARLYGGDPRTRIRQEVMLGIGGMAALAVLGIHPTVFHLNEGHAAFAALDHLRRLVARGQRLEQAQALVRSSTVFTTHTPVPAGHDRFPASLVREHLGPTARSLQMSWDAFVGLGRENPADANESFCMTVLALRLSQHCNGVSKLNGEVSREMWKRLYGVARAADVPIGHVTNGVHTRTWLAPEIETLYARYLKPRWDGAPPEATWWARAARIPPAVFWDMRRMLRRKLVHFVRQKLAEQVRRHGGSPAEAAAAYAALKDDALTIGFARRFATYKRAPLIFQNPRRLAAILSDSARPAQLVFAGKAHPKDVEGQKFVQAVHRFSEDSRFRGRVVVLENYDMEIGRVLTSGCDVWLNNPLRPREASGTSGMKPPLHGGLNCSILDGWWPEAYDGENGWSILSSTQRTPRAQDRADAAAIYELLEQQIIPLFYDRNPEGVPLGWVQRMIASLRTVAPRFSSHRMLADYLNGYYLPAHRK